MDSPMYEPDHLLEQARAKAEENPIGAVTVRELVKLNAQIAGLRAAAIATALLLGFFAVVLLYFLVGEGVIEIRLADDF